MICRFSQRLLPGLGRLGPGLPGPPCWPPAAGAFGRRARAGIIQAGAASQFSVIRLTLVCPDSGLYCSGSPGSSSGTTSTVVWTIPCLSTHPSVTPSPPSGAPLIVSGLGLGSLTGHLVIWLGQFIIGGRRLAGLGRQLRPIAGSLINVWAGVAHHWITGQLRRHNLIIRFITGFIGHSLCRWQFGHGPAGSRHYYRF